ncbi:MAG: MerR family transcriptional regulator [Anaerolineales bacterium]|nr:MerR family transcriptional regulator [Anaerolineales bacterium]
MTADDMVIQVNKIPRYNLNVVVRETGAKADTLRAWERRYGLPLPGRSRGGHRLYSQYDIETVKWLRYQRREKGMSISKAVGLWRSIETSGQDPLDASRPKTTTDFSITSSIPEAASLTSMGEKWLNACLSFDERKSEQILTQAFALFPVETVSTHILQKSLSTLGRLWYEGKASVQQEHFASELAIRRLHALIAAAPQPILKSKILIASPPGEQHAIPSLLLTFLLRNRGWEVTNLGTNVPREQLSSAFARVKPDLVVLGAMRLETAATLKEVALYLEERKIPLAFGGRIFKQLPELSRRIPGHFLGEEIPAAIPKIENILGGSSLQFDRKGDSDELAPSIHHFVEAKPAIDSQIMRWARGEFNQETIHHLIALANDHLGRDIIAALTLGDIGFLAPNIQWLDGFLTHRDISGDRFKKYLTAYQETAETMLSNLGRPIVDWLVDYNHDAERDGD